MHSTYPGFLVIIRRIFAISCGHRVPHPQRRTIAGKRSLRLYRIQTAGKILHHSIYLVTDKTGTAFSTKRSTGFLIMTIFIFPGHSSGMRMPHKGILTFPYWGHGIKHLHCLKSYGIVYSITLQFGNTTTNVSKTAKDGMI